MNTSEIKFLIDVGVGKEVENYISQSGVETPVSTPPPFQGENASRSDDGI